MTIKLYISSACANKEVKSQILHSQFVLSNQCYKIDFKAIDIVDPANKEDLEFYLANAKPNEKGQILPPQFFNEDEYCGDYLAFEEAVEQENIFDFLKLEAPEDYKRPSEEQAAEEEVAPEEEETAAAEDEETKEDSEETAAGEEEEKPAEDEEPAEEAEAKEEDEEVEESY